MIELKVTAETPDELHSNITGLASLFGAPAAEPKAPRSRKKAETEPVDTKAENAEPPAETKAEAVEETKKEAPPAEDKPALTNDEVKSYTINDYLNVVFDKQAERTEAFKSLLKEFDVDKFSALPDDKLEAVRARVAELIAAAQKS